MSVHNGLTIKIFGFTHVPLSGAIATSQHRTWKTEDDRRPEN